MRIHGKYTKVEKNNPRAVGQCDFSGFMGRRMDMTRQYEYIGNGLRFTGFWVIPKFADKPNPQLLPPLVKIDPIPIRDPRPDTWIE